MGLHPSLYQESEHYQCDAEPDYVGQDYYSLGS